MDFLDGIKNDYGWAWDNPGAIGDELLGLLPDRLKPAGTGFAQAPNTASPLVLDLDGDGVETSALGYGDGRSTTYFDMDNDGFAEPTGWATGGDGLLALDKNGNGKIDNQGEPFGNSATFADGFAALKALDSNADGKITSADAQWSKLRVWVDADKDGVTDAGELKTLADLKITQVNLNTTAQTNVYNNENAVSANSTFVMNGAARTVSDVWFRNDQMDTRFTGETTLNVKTLFLPTLKGFGNLKDLHVAMSGDAALLTLVENFAKNWSPARFTNAAALDADMKAILFKWAGVESVSPTSRGSYVDGQVIGFMEKLTGALFGGGTTILNPVGSNQGQMVTNSFEVAFSALKAQLIVQAGGQTLFDQPPSYDFVNGDIGGGVLGSAGIATLKAQAATVTDKLGYWKYVADFLLNVKGASEFTAAEESALDAAIKATAGSSYSWDSLVSLVPSPLTFSIVGTELCDYYVGGRSWDYHYGRGGNDILDGGEGNDTLYGEGENDVLAGGGGDDTLYGGKGNDTYVLSTGFGKDYVYDEGGTDTLKLDSAFSTENISLADSSSYNTMLIATAGTHEITISNQRYVGGANAIQFLQFQDGFKADLLTYKSWVWGATTAQTTNGTVNGDTILGRGGNDTINGNAGNDALHGGSGDDVVRGGDGNDTVHGGIGNDWLYGDAGNDTMFGFDGLDRQYGGAGDDTPYGDAGNDLLYGDDRLDKLYGGLGADIFVFRKDTAFKNIDVVNDFKTAELDRINVADILEGYNPATKAITDFVQLTTSGTNSLLFVDKDGGANGFVQVATISGVTGLTDETALKNSGLLIAA